MTQWLIEEAANLVVDEQLARERRQAAEAEDQKERLTQMAMRAASGH